MSLVLLINSWLIGEIWSSKDSETIESDTLTHPKILNMISHWVYLRNNKIGDFRLNKAGKFHACVQYCRKNVQKLQTFFSLLSIKAVRKLQTIFETLMKTTIFINVKKTVCKTFSVSVTILPRRGVSAMGLADHNWFAE